MQRSILIVAILVLVGCRPQTYPKVVPEWNGPVAKVDVEHIVKQLDACPCLEFSPDSKLLITHYLCMQFSEDKVSSRSFVYDLSGNECKAAVDEQGALTPDYARLFSNAKPAWWKSYHAVPSKILEIAKKKEIAPKDFQYKIPYQFNQDASLCLILNKKEKPGDFRDYRILELWKVRPSLECAWTTDLPVMFGDWTVADFFEQNGSPLVLVVNDSKAFIFEQKTGKLIDKFTVGEDETKEQLDDYEKQLTPKMKKISDPDMILKFSAFQGDCDPEHHMLALGAFYGRRVRVFSLVPPYQKLFEAHTYDHPYLPGGGTWSVNRVEFAGGNYLIAESDFAGRGGLLPCQSYRTTDIFDLITKKRVWHESRDEIKNVTLSPDGKKLAFTRGNILEIGDFVPIPESPAKP